MRGQEGEGVGKGRGGWREGWGEKAERGERSV